MRIEPALGLLIAAVAANGLLAGASGDQTVKQLPARRRIGVMAYSDYSRAGDLGNGIAWYATLGVGTAVLSLIAAVAALLPGGRHGGAGVTAASWALVVTTVGHLALTGLAAPTNHAQRRHLGDPEALERVFDRFERLQAGRWALNLAALASAIWALVTLLVAT